MIGTNWDLHWKWMTVKEHLDKAINGYSDTFYINHLSASGGSFPYFVASGRISAGTSSSRLATGLTTPGWKNTYPYFPRVNFFIGICTIAFEGTNILARNETRKINAIIKLSNIINSVPVNISVNKKETVKIMVGIIMADFPGESLIQEIIKNNVKLKNSPEING